MALRRFLPPRPLPVNGDPLPQEAGPGGEKDPKPIAEMVRLTRQVPGYRPMPVLCNEDDHFDFDKPINNMIAAIGEYASWGYFDPEGYQSPPVNWGLDTDRKKGFFQAVRQITGQ